MFWRRRSKTAFASIVISMSPRPPGCWSSSATGSALRIRCSRRFSWHQRRSDGADACIAGLPASPTAGKSASCILRSPIDPPNAGVAAELDGAAIAARARAAPAAAAELAEQALALTPHTDSRALFDRRLAAARFHQEAGSSAQAGVLAEAAAAGAETSSDPRRLRFNSRWSQARCQNALPFSARRPGRGEVDPGLRGEILATLGLELDAATEGAPFPSEAAALAERDTNKERRVRVLCLVAWGRTWASGAVDSDLLERALELAEGSAISTSFAATTYGSLLAMAYENERARELHLNVRGARSRYQR